LTTAKESTTFMDGRSRYATGRRCRSGASGRFGRALAAAAILPGAAVGLASPSAAGDLLGVYDFKSDSGETGVWTATPCGAGCVSVGVTNISPNWNDQRFTGQATEDNGQWYMRVDVRYAVRCDINQLLYPGQFEYVWDAATLTGTAVAIQTTPNCGRPAMAREAPTGFVLIRRPPA
jgi:hypothetical protein